MEKRPIKIMDTTMRDGQQSLIATRMRTEDMLPILEKMDKVGFYAMEVWGGATFDACLRFLDEDPWERLRKIRAKVKNTKLQMLFRGQNILGYKQYPDDMVEAFVEKTLSNGIDIMRVFDALNDTRNLETSVRAIKKFGGEAQLCISYTLSEIHTVDYYIDLARRLEDMGADSICIKDMAGLLLPESAYELCSAIKSATKIPLQVHSHCTSGVAPIVYVRAAQAGADIIDTAMSPFGMGTSQPATEVMNAAFAGTPYDPGLDQALLAEIAEHFRPMRDEALKSGLLSPKVLGVDIETLRYQVPGGMLSNLVSQLKEADAEDKYAEVLREIPLVRADLGFPPLVTPTSQIVGTQAVLNVLTGERYKVAPKETKDLARGMYGRTPAPVSPEIIEKVAPGMPVITCRPADLVEPELKKAEAELGIYKEQPEDVLSYALFPQVALEYFKKRQAKKYDMEEGLIDRENNVYPV
ncbi:MAG: oxaloacetate decarboxylase subunit alpha [Firmicutes bacterium]|nr:oxaloacetate decarboxylase subunit alpha [Bacillota bacterium]